MAARIFNWLPKPVNKKSFGAHRNWPFTPGIDCTVLYASHCTHQCPASSLCLPEDAQARKTYACQSSSCRGAQLVSTVISLLIHLNTSITKCVCRIFCVCTLFTWGPRYSNLPNKRFNTYIIFTQKKITFLQSDCRELARSVKRRRQKCRSLHGFDLREHCTSLRRLCPVGCCSSGVLVSLEKK